MSSAEEDDEEETLPVGGKYCRNTNWVKSAGLLLQLKRYIGSKLVSVIANRYWREDGSNNDQVKLMSELYLSIT